MTETQLILGENVTLEIYKGGEYVPYACAIDISIETSVETREVRTITDGKWKKTRPRKWAYTVSLSGLVLFNDTDPHAFDLQSALIGGNYIDYRIKFDEPNSTLVKIINGIMLVTNSTLAGAATGFASGNFDFEGFGEYTITDGVLGCEAAITDVEVVENDSEGFYPNRAQVTVSGISGATRLDYTIDGGERDSIFISGSGAVFYILNMGGTHTIVVYPVCENGEDGEGFLKTFTIS